MQQIGLIGLMLAAVIMAGCDVEYAINQDNDGVGAPDNVDGQGTTGGEGIPENVARGDVQGRICAPDGETWVQGAVVYIDTEWGRLSTTTDVDGYFKLEDVPVGNHEIQIEKGSFSASVEVVIAENELLQLATDECVGDVNIGVISGYYDNIQSILQRLAIPYDEIMGGMDDYGNEPEHIEFLRDPARMANYDILFFNCGIDDSRHGTLQLSKTSEITSIMVGLSMLLIKRTTCWKGRFRRLRTSWVMIRIHGPHMWARRDT